MSFICHIHNYTEYNQQWNVFSAFNPSKCTHTPGAVGSQHCSAQGSSWGFGALLKGLTSVVDNSCRSREFEPTTSGYKSNDLSIRSRLPLLLNCCVSPSNTAVFRFWTNPHFLNKSSESIDSVAHS